MAYATSKWTTIASNSSTPAAVGENVSIIQTATGASGTNGHVRHECLLWMDGTAAMFTEPFDWSVHTDATIVLNATLNDITADAGNVDVDMQGSIDGTNYVKMQDLATWDAGGGAAGEAIGHLVYDFDTYGKMPYMRLALTGDDANCTTAATNVKINVFMHNG